MAQQTDDPAIVKDVLDLLSRSEEFHSNLDVTARLDAAVALASCSEQDSEVPDFVGPWHILQKLAEGGAARVYLADRIGSPFRQQAAIKLLLPSMASPDLKARFSQERQILAGLDCPDIARLLDGGVTRSGLSWLAMEYVKGENILSHCNRLQHTISERIELVVCVAKAVSVAHRQLIVHRDIKPSNILVTDQGQVKLLDFGIAKLLGDPAHPEPLLTRTESRVLTLEYASPEQIGNRRITTATDIYQLGALLFELVTGNLPFRRGSLLDHEFHLQILQSPPPAPSTQLRRQENTERALHAAERSDTPKQLNTLLRGDLDRIILHCLRKDPDSRYASVDGLIQDLQNWLHRRPISIRGQHWPYRARMFFGRHRWGLSLAALTLVLSLGLGTKLLLQNQQLGDALLRSESSSRYIEMILELPISQMQGNQGSIDLSQLMDHALVAIEDNFPEASELKADLLFQVGLKFSWLSKWQRSAEVFRDVLNMLSALRGENDARVLEVKRKLARDLHFSGRYVQAEELYRELIVQRRSIDGELSENYAEAIKNLGGLLHSRGEYFEAEKLLLQAYSLKQRLNGRNSIRYATASRDLGDLYKDWRQFSKAVPYFSTTLAIERKSHNYSTRLLALTLDAMGDLKTDMGDYVAAEALILEAKKLRDDEHIRGPVALGDSYLHLAKLAAVQGDFGLAMEYAAQGRAIYDQFIFPEHPFVRRIEGDYAYYLHLSGATQGASDLIRLTLESLRTAHLELHPFAAKIYLIAAIVYAKEGNCDWAMHATGKASKVWQARFTAGQIMPLTRQLNESACSLKETLRANLSVNSGTE